MTFSNSRPSIRLVKNKDESIKLESNKTGADLSITLRTCTAL